ncbi:MAG: hypothetical protein JNM12_03810 [Alphaproteobacteria bacterium]|nr:hypothetical protein [Alphaproteobacteria bacterium]
MFEKLKAKKLMREFNKISDWHEMERFFARLVLAPDKQQAAVIDEVEKNLVARIEQTMPRGEQLAQLQRDIADAEKLNKVFTMRDMNDSTVMVYRMAEIIRRHKGENQHPLLKDYLKEADKMPENHLLTTFGFIKVIAALATKAEEAEKRAPVKKQGGLKFGA